MSVVPLCGAQLQKVVLCAGDNDPLRGSGFHTDYLPVQDTAPWAPASSHQIPTVKAVLFPWIQVNHSWPSPGEARASWSSVVLPMLHHENDLVTVLGESHRDERKERHGLT